MNLPQRLPPGPAKRFDRYFTVPINATIFEALERLKWRTQLDKTEVVRRFVEYLLTLPPESQDKLLHSFDAVHKVFKPSKLRKQRIDAQIHKKQTEHLTYKKQVEETKSAPPIVRIVKRSGLP